MLKKSLSAPLSLSFSGILVIGCYSSYSVAKQSSDLKQRSWISRYNEFDFEWGLIRNFSFLDEGCSGLALHEPHCNYHNNIPDLTEVILGIRILTNETAAASARFCDCVYGIPGFLMKPSGLCAHLGKLSSSLLKLSRQKEHRFQDFENLTKLLLFTGVILLILVMNIYSTRTQRVAHYYYKVYSFPF